jgi:NADPH-dependent 2,4-dienoyl-CoA reductase/sulfur reductase-like enzyme
MSYGNSLLAKSMSPVHNQRTDKYGGRTMNERATFAREVFGRVRAACSSDFIIEAQVSGEEPGGYTIDDLCEFVKACEGVLDVVQVRGADVNVAHPIGINSVEGEPVTLKYAETLKKSGTSVVIAPVGGYQDPDLNERYLAEGKADFIYMARAFICDSDYGQKITEGRPEDIVPCVLCNACHTLWNQPDAGCVVNPRIVLSLDHNYRVEPPAELKKVAVIGGGPAGMMAALVADEQGHSVTLYEKAGVLGGQLTHTDYCSFKWPLRNFKNYLISQIAKSAIDVRMETAATPGLLEDKDYDAIILAAGARHRFPDIPGVEGRQVWNPLGIYGHEDELGKRVVVIGGAMTGMETAVHLAMHGHEITNLTRQERLAHDGQPVHFREMYEEKWQTMDNFTPVTNATTTAIGTDSVTYTDTEGNSHTIPADSVVACGGLDPCQENALEFAALTGYFRVIGDCRSVKDVRTAVKNAYTAVSGL